MFSYSIVIRTLGNTGEKYLQMLHAIERQSIKPLEIVVVIPDGYDLDHSLGNERIVRSKKGMVTQRAVGIIEAKGDYLLLLDDDLDFPSDFAEKLHNYLIEESLDCVLAFGEWNPERVSENVSGDITRNQKITFRIKQLRGAFTGQYYYSQRKSVFFDTIISTGGHRTYVNNPTGLCQTGSGGCCFIRSAKAKEVHLHDELWLDQLRISSYAAYEDAVFYYKLYLQGGRIAYTQETDFTHLDAAAGRPAKSRLESKRIRLYTIARNRTIFWHRHIWSNHRSLHTLLGGIYGMVNYALYNIAANIHPKYWPAIGAMMQGYHDAFRFIRSK